MSTLGKKELILLAIIASIAGFFFYDFLVENVLAVILSIFGLGGASIAKTKAESKKSKIIADEHIEMSNHAIDQATMKTLEADLADKQTQDIANGINKPNDQQFDKSTSKRKHFSAS